jgi:hypothetical protein
MWSKAQNVARLVTAAPKLRVQQRPTLLVAVICAIVLPRIFLSLRSSTETSGIAG